MTSSTLLIRLKESWAPGIKHQTWGHL